MQPLGLTRSERDAYHAFLFSSHKFDMFVDVLRTDGHAIASARGVLLDGQVNIQRKALIRRTATMTLYDPDRTLHLDNDSPWEGAMFADRMLRVRHVVRVPDVGEVTAVPFVGPVAKLRRGGDVLSVECQDKSAFAVTGRTTMTVVKHANVVDAIKRIMRATGERHFRFPSGVRKRLSKDYNVGWNEKSAPWPVCQRIAREAGLQLFYSCDGYCTLQRRGGGTFLILPGRAITEAPTFDHDITEVKNRVRVAGTWPKVTKREKDGPDKDKKPDLTIKQIKVGAVATAGPKHPMRPGALGRNGEPRFLPLVITGVQFKKKGEAAKLAGDELAANLPMTTGVTLQCAPFFHGDVVDAVRVVTSAGAFQMPMSEASIPLGVGGDMSLGAQKRVSKGRRRG